MSRLRVHAVVAGRDVSSMYEALRSSEEKAVVASLGDGGGDSDGDDGGGGDDDGVCVGAGVGAGGSAGGGDGDSICKALASLGNVLHYSDARRIVDYFANQSRLHGADSSIESGEIVSTLNPQSGFSGGNAALEVQVPSATTAAATMAAVAEGAPAEAAAAGGGENVVALRAAAAAGDRAVRAAAYACAREILAPLASDGRRLCAFVAKMAGEVAGDVAGDGEGGGGDGGGGGGGAGEGDMIGIGGAVGGGGGGGGGGGVGHNGDAFEGDTERGFGPGWPTMFARQVEEVIQTSLRQAAGSVAVAECI
eukprot:5739204-Pleurochrysis_carterae.AAC.2